MGFAYSPRERRFTMPTKKSKKVAKKLSKGKNLKAVKPLLNPQPLPPYQHKI
jgi:hypothetical protein